MTIARAARRTTTLAIVAAVLVAGCDGGDDDDVATDTTPSTSPATTTTAAAGATTTTAPATTTSAPTPSTAEGDLPGEPVEFGPTAGAVLGVVGVAHDDTLNVRAAPGTDQEVVTELAPLADDLVATGRNRSLPESVWYEVETAAGPTGWVSASFVAQLGDTVDVTAEVQAALGELPGGETMVDLADAVAGARAALDEEPIPRITVTVAPTVGDLGEITVDVVGYPDDAVLGERLHVFGTPAEGGEAFVLRTVESQSLCRRGVSDGLCV
jgi:hypothetical protein